MRLRAERDQAVQAAVRLGQDCAKLRDVIESLTTDNTWLTNEIDRKRAQSNKVIKELQVMAYELMNEGKEVRLMNDQLVKQNREINQTNKQMMMQIMKMMQDVSE